MQMDKVPQHCVSVPLILNSILDQLERINNSIFLSFSFLVSFILHR